MLKLVLILSLLLISSAAQATPQQDFVRAVEMNSATAVRKLLDAKVDPNTAEPQRGEPGLVLAVREDAMDVVDVLLAHPGIRVDATANNGNTALMMAAFKGNMAAVKKLLAKGAAINRTGWTPLHYAAAGGHGDIVRFLIEQGASINAVSTHGITPLIMAAQEGKHDAIVALLEKGADRSLRNSEKLTAAEVAEKVGKPFAAETIRNFGTER